jgi:hypothetical protein
MDVYKDRILALGTTANHSQSYDLFREVYAWHRPCEWASDDSNNVFDVGNAIARFRPDLVSVGIRLNVQVNLFLKSIKRFGTSEQFDRVGQDSGCFALTERGAGVLSGMTVKTTFETIVGGYLLDTPDSAADKNWISQGSQSTWTLCIAANRSDTSDVRLFLVSSALGTREIMDVPTVQISHTVDLCTIRYAQCLVYGECVLEGSIGVNRRNLLSGICHGRYMIAEAVVHSILCLCERVLISLGKRWSGKTVVMEDISSLQCFRDATSEYAQYLARLRCDGLIRDRPELVPLYKTACTEWAIAAHANIHLRFTTYAMQAGLSFETFILNKLAEGDTDVLRLSMVIDDGRNTMMSRVLKVTDGPIDPVGLYDHIRIGWGASSDIQKIRMLSSVIMKKNITLPPDSTKWLDGLGFRSLM